MKQHTHDQYELLMLLLLLLFRHNAKSLDAQEERLATLPYLVSRLHLPHVIVVRLHVRKINIIILTPETAGTVGVGALAYPCRYDFPSRTKPWMLLGPHHRGLTSTRTLLTCSLNWE